MSIFTGFLEYLIRILFHNIYRSISDEDILKICEIVKSYGGDNFRKIE